MPGYKITEKPRNGKWKPGGRGRPPGGPKLGGRPPGQPNKITRDIKEMIIGALNDAGGQAYLAARALDAPTAFLALVGRVLPMQVTGANGGALAVDFRWADATDAAGNTVNHAPSAHTHTLTIDGDHTTIDPIDAERQHDAD